MCADICTEAFTDASTWPAACDLINIVDPSRLRQFITGYFTPPTPVAMLSPLVDEPTRCDLDSIVDKVDGDRQLVEINFVEHYP